MKRTILLGLALLSLPLHAANYSPEALIKVKDRVSESVKLEKNPVLIFDLDDTLINTRERSLRILKEFANENRIDPEASRRIGSLQLVDVQYVLEDTLRGLGLTDANLIKTANQYWLTRFFSNDYCAHDQPTRGAASYVTMLVDMGATVVYLTGRDMPRMETGTIENLRNQHFPLDLPRVKLMMKPNKEMDDLQFKKDAFQKISELGVVLAGFENEPANINAMKAQFPDATMVFLDSIHSKKPDTVSDGVFWVRSFLTPPETGL